MPNRTSLVAVLSILLLLGVTACGDDSDDAPPGSDGGDGDGDGDAGGDGDGDGDAGTDSMVPDLEPGEVMTDKGVVRGTSDDGVLTFKGIPFAAPPTGDNRFKAPQPAEAWTETLVANEPGGICPQISPSTRAYTGEEDCLYLNVFAPDPMPNAPLPVMVWIHGGAYVFGSGSDASYDGSHLVKRGDVVVVTLNYRLGALGYVAHEALSDSDESTTSGNYGLLDQVAAMQWVKDNIAGFGGDADNVTIFGESAGGHSVCWHLVAPGSQGLFHRAIVESGYCMKPTYPRADAEAQGERFATALGCTDEAEVVSCMRDKTPEEVVMAAQSTGTPSPGGIFYQDRGTGFAFEPTIDGVNITDQLATLLAGDDVADVPVLQGANTDEGILFHLAVLSNVTPVMTYDEYLAALTTRYGQDNADAIIAQYPAADFEDDPNAAIAEVSADGVFLCPARETAKLLAARASGDTYLYNFGVVLDVNPAVPALAGLVFHSAELPYVWGNPYALGMVPEESQPTADALQDYLLQFARTGDPNTATSPAEWPAYAAAGDTLLSFGAEIESISDLKKAECDFWETITPPALP